MPAPGQLALLIAAGLAACGNAHDPRDPIADGPASARECPTHLDLELIGSGSRFLAGWSGYGHGVGLPEGSTGTVEITGCDSECRRCSFRGPIPSTTYVVAQQRCLANTALACDENNPCPTGACRFVFPPVASADPLPTCSLVYFEPLPDPEPWPLRGVIDLATGELDMEVMNIYVQLSIGGCQTCIDDTDPNDAVPDGECHGFNGMPLGVACDRNGVSTRSTELTSYDCAPPDSNLVIPLAANGTSTSGAVWTMTGDEPDCVGNNQGYPCWCGMCSDGKPCTHDRDCVAGSCGVPSGPPGGMTYLVNNNSCPNECVWDAATQTGECPSGLSCFPDSGSITAHGAAEVGDGFYIAQIANLLCMPAFGSGSVVDLIGGFPGPFLFEARFRINPRRTP